MIGAGKTLRWKQLLGFIKTGRDEDVAFLLLVEQQLWGVGWFWAFPAFCSCLEEGSAFCYE